MLISNKTTIAIYVRATHILPSLYNYILIYPRWGVAEKKTFEYASTTKTQVLIGAFMVIGANGAQIYRLLMSTNDMIFSIYVEQFFLSMTHSLNSAFNITQKMLQS